MKPLSHGGEPVLCANGDYELHFAAPTLWRNFACEIMVVNAKVKLVAHTSGVFRHGDSSEKEVELTEQKIHRVFGQDQGYDTDFALSAAKKPAARKARKLVMCTAKPQDVVG